MERMLPGSELTPEDRARVLASYVHRYTKQHVPHWARNNEFRGGAYPVQFESDEDWLKHTLFHVTTRGRLDHRHKYCMSYPTWPDNPELRE